MSNLTDVAADLQGSTSQRTAEFFELDSASSTVLIVNVPNVVIKTFVLSTPQCFDSEINSLHDDVLHLRKPMKIRVELIDHEEVIATALEADISMSGDSPADAIDGLRSQLVDLYKIFSQEKRCLGPVQKKQLSILEDYVAKKREK